MQCVGELRQRWCVSEVRQRIEARGTQVSEKTGAAPRQTWGKAREEEEPRVNIEPLVPRILRRKSAPPAGLREPPLLSGALPVLGHTVEFVRSTIGLLSRAQRELGEVATLQIVGRRMVAVFGP